MSSFMIEEILKTKIECRPNAENSDDRSKTEFDSSFCSRQKNSNKFSETDVTSERTAIPSNESSDWNWKQQSKTFGKEAIVRYRVCFPIYVKAPYSGASYGLRTKR